MCVLSFTLNANDDLIMYIKLSVNIHNIHISESNINVKVYKKIKERCSLMHLFTQKEYVQCKYVL